MDYSKLMLYTELKVGKSLCNYLIQADTLETQIGSYRKGANRVDYEYIVGGIQIRKNEQPIDMLTSIKSSLDATRKFKEYGNSTCNLIQGYIDECGEQFKKYEGVLKNKIANIESSKEVIIPFKLESTAIVDVDGVKVTCDLVGIKYYNHDSKLEYKLMFRSNDEKSRDRNIILKDVSSYLKEFTIESYKCKGKVNGIELSRFGYVQPIELETGNEFDIAIDGTFLYIIKNGQIFIGGAWNRSNELSIENGVKSEIEKKATISKWISKNIGNISKHRKLIAPFRIVESTKIKL